MVSENKKIRKSLISSDKIKEHLNYSLLSFYVTCFCFVYTLRMNRECFHFQMYTTEKHGEANNTVSATVPAHKGILSVFKLHVSENFVANTLKFLSINIDQCLSCSACQTHLKHQHLCFSCILIQLPCDGFPGHKKREKH